MKVMLLCAVTVLLCLQSSNADDRNESDYDQALADQSNQFKAMVLALEKNMKVRHFRNECYAGFIERGLYVTVVLIPLNEDVIETAIAYKQHIENIDVRVAESMLRRNLEQYTEGDRAAFALMVNVRPYQHYDRGRSNREFDTRDYVAFKDFAQNTILRNERGQAYSLTGYTRIFDSRLSASWNNGYLYFENFRSQADSFSYSVHFKELIINTVIQLKGCTPTLGDWSFSFDETEVHYLTLFEKGLSIDTIRANYGIRPAYKEGVSIENILSAFSVVLTMIGFLL